MDSSVTVAFVALALCIPIVAVGMALFWWARMQWLQSMWDARKKRRKPPPLGGNPYHLP